MEIFGNRLEADGTILECGDKSPLLSADTRLQRR
jgi:hypothetical protein